MHLSLGWKAAALILFNVVLTFSAGLLARNFVLNPELAKVERINDEKILHQLEVIEGLIQNNMAESANRIKAIAARIDGNHWERFATSLSELAAASELSYVIAATSDGGLLQVRPGKYFDASESPTPQDINRILNLVRQHEAVNQTLVTLLEGKHGPMIIAAARLQRAEEKMQQGPSLFVAVSHIDAAFIQRINLLSGVELTLISDQQFDQLRTSPRALSGLRSTDNQLHWNVNGVDGKPVLTAAISLPPRSYDDQFFSPTLAIALLITLATWCIAIWLLHRTIISPMNNASKTLQSIMEDKDYGRQLEYKHYDEFGRLVAFCNKLLGMVDKHTTELQALSLTDPLTELNNRRAFDTQSQKFWALAERSNTRMALIAFDIDHFKSYNDRYGHPAGDKVIKAFAGILEHTFKRASDVVARVGGEEFLVITQDTPAGACLVLTNRVLQELRDLRLEHTGNPVGCVTASAGVFQATPDANLSLEIALIRADEILYAAKHEGRNRAMYSDALVNSMSTIKTADIHQLPRNS
ncbi:MAG: hypothetical protein CMN85_17245 [Spongiibacteraceae bacterium]|nr:hypothetical protein [Spongiibacteraceae bacterium]